MIQQMTHRGEQRVRRVVKRPRTTNGHQSKPRPEENQDDKKRTHTLPCGTSSEYKRAQVAKPHLCTRAHTHPVCCPPIACRKCGKEATYNGFGGKCEKW